MNRLTYAEVDLSAIRKNIESIRDRVGPNVRIIPAVKADGYGHGAVQTSRACLDGGADALCVANVVEAVELREAGFEVPVLVLGCIDPASSEEVVRHDVSVALCDITLAKALSSAAVSQNKEASVHIKIDTGMGRIGIRAENVVEFARALRELPGMSIGGAFTHFPCSDEEDRSFTLQQINAFKGILADLRSDGTVISTVHASNSGGILGYPEADFDAVRPGIMIYGLYPSPESARSIPLTEALTLKTRIVFLKDAQAGSTVSYGRTYTLKRASKIATIPIGYGDGYPRLLSNRGDAAVRSARVPIVGRVCMDQCLIDVTDVPNVQVGDEVVLYGGGYDYLSISEVAEKIGTIPNDILCAIGKRVPRLYVDN